MPWRHITSPGRSLSSAERDCAAAYPEPGTYTLAVEADAGLTVTIESQNQQETMMHTSTELYRGEASGAQFAVGRQPGGLLQLFCAGDGTGGVCDISE
ncbi:MAG: hypothetical protein ACLSB9_21910 [Hydrogeniiclostridium mannosilyticum]